MVAVHAIKFFTAGGDEPDRQVVIGIEQQGANGGRIATTGYLVLEQEIADGCQILSDFRRHDVERASQRQDGIHVLDMCIKRERTVPLNAVGSRQFLHVNDNVDEVPQSGLVQHGALGLACRARRIDHIGQIVGSRQVDRVCIHAEIYILHEDDLHIARIEITLCLFAFQHSMAGDEHLRLGILQHILQTLVGIFEIHGCIGCTSLVDGQY